MILSIPDEILYRLHKIRHKWVEVELLISDHHYATFIIFFFFFVTRKVWFNDWFLPCDHNGKGKKWHEHCLARINKNS
jgi:hypothetical protein